MTPLGHLNTLWPSYVARNFCRILQISPKHLKISQCKSCVFVEGHNFHVDWHLRFGVEMREKAWSMPRVTIHQRPEICHLGMHFVHEWL
jgi:hypothetical protein